MPARGLVRLLDRDPDLAGHLSEAEARQATQVALVSTVSVPTGVWEPGDEPAWGLLVLDGMLVREVQLAGQSSAELIGPSDVLQRSVGHHTDPLVPSRVSWTALEPTTVAWLGDRFAAAVHRWPALAACLLERSERRAARLALTQAISHLVRVDVRVHVLLWLVAERWGRVGREGVVVPLRLTHKTIAQLVGARRPTVTTAISDLAARERIVRRGDGAWILRGGPPAEVLDAHPAPHAFSAIQRLAPEARVVDPAVVAPAARASQERAAVLRSTYSANVAQLQSVAERSEQLRTQSREIVAQLRRMRATTAALRDAG